MTAAITKQKLLAACLLTLPVAACLLTLPVAVFGAELEKEALSIDAAINYALTDNYSVQLAHTSIATRQEEISAAQREGWPALDLEVDVLRGSGKPTSFSAIHNMNDPVAPPVDVQKGNYGYARLTFTAPLYEDGAFFFQDRAGTKAAKAEYSRSEANSKQQEAVTANVTAKSFLSALSASEIVKLRQQASERLQKRLTYIQARVAAHIDPQSDALLAKATLAEQTGNLNAARRTASMQQLQLSFALGLPAPETLTVLPLTDPPPPVPDVAALAKKALLDQPLLRAQQAAVKNAEAERDVTRAKTGPTLAFVAMLQSASDLKITQDNYAYADFNTVGVKLTMPLLDLSTHAKVKAGNYAVAEAEATMYVTRNLLTQTIYSTYYDYTDSLDKISSAQKQLDLLEYQQKTSTARYEQHLSGLDQLLKDETAALDQRVALVQYHYAAWSAYADLVQALGYRFTSETMLTAP
jgi:outer membrane protein TolC